LEMRAQRRQDWIDYAVRAEIDRSARLERMRQITLYLDTLAKLRSIAVERAKSVVRDDPLT
jgi:hypothetical protein